ncbi:hypothetical protein ABZ723_30170 [Streptomyces sp. NPDC006700]|uniref:hypothetical protein n=1 Tax=Streptomyces sp. NPDC006700 TaxID=3154479 RepID=UPI0034097236
MAQQTVTLLPTVSSTLKAKVLMDKAELLMLLSGAALVVIEVVRSVPAWLRVKRTRSGGGISPVSVGVLAGTGPGWIAVAAMADSLAAVIATITWMVFHVLLWREVAQAEPSMKRAIAASALAGFVITGLIAVIGQLAGYLESALGMTVVAATASYSLPALYRGMKSPTTTGLSLVSLAVNTVEGAIYFVAGIGLGGITRYGDPVLVYAFFGALAVLSNLPRFVRAALRRALGRDGEASLRPRVVLSEDRVL